MKKRVVSLVLALSLCTSLLVVSASASFNFSLSLADLVDSFNDFFSETNNDNFSPNVCNSYWARSHYDTYSYSALEDYVLTLNSSSEQYGYKFDIQPLENTNFYGIRILYQTGSYGGGRYTHDHYGSFVVAWLADAVGNAVLSTPGSSSITSVRAIPRAQAASAGFYKMLSYEDLYNLAYDYNTQHNYKLALNTDGIYWAISSRGDYVLANESGLPYGAAGPSSITSGGSRPDVTTNEDHIIDWLNNTVGSNDGVYGFDNVLYDSNNKTYYVDNSVSYQNSFNEYYYYNWSYTYNIDYTNITYIGSSAEYTETYECYYELPDGRSSADLTKEDLEQLNLSMDVVPYIRSSDDTRLRSLYHFDGNTEDASYWNYATSFDWTTGASLTYLESNAFNGCLYLDELTHDFTITLPSSLGSGDFTVDFRYYQSATLAPQDDSYISIGGQDVLYLNGSYFGFNGDTFNTPVGNWNHLAFVRQDGTLYFYLNGVQQGSMDFSNVLSSAVEFYFGSDQQTYKYLDELRVTNFAVWESNFTSPTVPYDTNLSLVLPTDTVPVADEYWNITCENNLLSEFNLDWWDISHLDSGAASSNLLVYPDGRSSSVETPNFYVNGSSTSFSRVYSNSLFGTSSSPISPYSGYPTVLISDTDYNSLSVGSSTKLNSSSSVVLNSFYSGQYALYSRGGLTWFFSGSNYNGSNKFNNLSAGNYTLTLVEDDGTVSFFTFNHQSYSSSFSRQGIDYTDYSLGSWTARFGKSYRQGSYTPFQFEFLTLFNSNYNGKGIVYLALEEGTQSTVTAELVSGVAGIPADDLNTPTLAVRSDIPMPSASGSFGGGRGGGFGDTSSGSFGGSSSGSSSGSFGDGRGGGFGSHSGYQIGGVRPTFAERGFVYAMVESGFITSLQQYTGYAWQAVDGRIWTGSRWIPYSSYNVITLSDMYDIADASGQGGYEYIYSQSGFWSWWQKQWLEFKQWYSTLSFSGGGGGDTNVDVDVPIIAPSAEWDFSDEDYNFVDLLIELPKTAFSTANGLLKTVGNTLKNVPLALNEFVVQGNPLNPFGAFKVFIIPGT